MLRYGATEVPAEGPDAFLAAVRAGDRAEAERLPGNGADPHDRAFGGTASAWARNAGDMEMARCHAEPNRSLLNSAGVG